MTIRTIKGRIVLAIVLVGCIPLLISLILAYMSGMRSLRDVIGGIFSDRRAGCRSSDDARAERSAGVRLLASAPLRVRQPVEAANLSLQRRVGDTQRLIQERAKEWEKGHDNAAGLLNLELCLDFFSRRKSVTATKWWGC